MGCGKSTLLNCLEVNESIRQNFLVVALFIKEVSDPDAIEATDALFGAMIAALDRALNESVVLERGRSSLSLNCTRS